MSIKRILILAVAGIVAASSGYGLRAATEPHDLPISTETSKDFPLLARRIFLDNPNDTLINFSSLRNQFNTYFTSNNLKGSLYFEYLPTGASARETADSEQIAASLMKLPAAMDAMRAIETGKISADHEIVLRQEWLDSGFGELYKKGAGYKLKLKDAIEIMLTQSDNTALKAVGFTTVEMVQQSDSVLKVVDIDWTQNTNLTVSIGARSYGSFLKCLYFACFNSKENSNLLLSYLAKSDFNDRLVAGIEDKSLRVAHKIGVYATVQSDCGIVYVPNRNYLICVMINGPDNNDTSQHIAMLSKLAYDYVIHL